MNKKENRVKKTAHDNKVEDIYGVHFRYDDLFSRLLKVQKQRQMSEEKHKLPRMASFDFSNYRQASASKCKNIGVRSKKSGSTKDLKAEKRFASVKKNVVKLNCEEKKGGIFKSYSPGHKRGKKLSVQIKSSAKKTEKKGGNTARIIKKSVVRTKEN